ncbi:Histidine biosynthesis bifunctional protein hisB [Phlyctochytrium planicorne]|nr:Histidine biosynthesis bifunctional protein hisB [Phlyctochytrium planicorne]
MGTYMLDYGAGNVRSLINAVKRLGHDIKAVESADDLRKAERLIFPGVGAFGAAMDRIRAKGYDGMLQDYLASGKPFLGICVGMQCLFNGSAESPGVAGLGVIPAMVSRFNDKTKSVPHLGWNAAKQLVAEDAAVTLINHDGEQDSRYYFIHSFAAILKPEQTFPEDWAYTLTTYQDEVFVSSIRRGNIFATQFHPEKSGAAGLKLLRSFLECTIVPAIPSRPFTLIQSTIPRSKDHLSRRIIACLDVRANDQGDLVVTKGDQYDVRESSEGGNVRNLGKPVDLSQRYFEEGADEITFLNITSFRNSPLQDLPMLEVLKRASEKVFVPLTVGGGIRDLEDPATGAKVPALEVAGEYFRSGADKVSIGSDAVYAAEEFWARGGALTGETAIEQISKVYGSQAVVISVDPRRIYVAKPEDAPTHRVIPTKFPGPNGESFVWYQCTVKGGRDGRDLDVKQLVTACEKLGAGEILCNCMDKDGTNSGFDLELLSDIKASVSIPVIASSGAGVPAHFSEVFKASNVDAALAAGIFHRKEVPISDVKGHLLELGFEVRPHKML